MGKMIKYEKRDKLGPLNIIYLYDIKPYKKDKTNRIIRKAVFICPECNKKFIAKIQDIKSGNTKSCGCRKIKQNKINGKNNGGKNSNNLINKKFNRLLVLNKTEDRTNNGEIIWQCQCDCGNITYVSTSHLKSNHTKSCGCLFVEKMEQSINDLTNKKFGKLTVLEKTNKRKNNSVVWKCKCECGNIIEVSNSHLISGGTQSCGCLRSKGEQQIAKILKNKNIYFFQEFKFKKCINPKTNYQLRFDFYLPDYNCCIEYDGEQHFLNIEYWSNDYNYRKELDEIKNQYCKDNNIKLIRISYTEYDNIEQILIKKLNLKEDVLNVTN